MIRTKPLKGPRKVWRLHFFRGPPLKGYLLCLFALAACKRVHKLFQSQLICRLIRLKLISDIFRYLLFIPPYCIYIVPSRPEMVFPVLVLQIRMSVENHQAAFSLKISHDLRYTVLWRYIDEHVDMVGTRFCFYELYPLLLAWLPQYHPDILFDLTTYLHPAVFRCKYDVILTSPTGMFLTTYVFIFHDEDLPVLVFVWSANHSYFSRELFLLSFSL